MSLAIDIASYAVLGHVPPLPSPLDLAYLHQFGNFHFPLYYIYVDISVISA